MFKNKIYKYIIKDVLKNFFTILLTFTLIAWTVRAVNFLDLLIEDGFSLNTYIKYSLLNISTIASRFVALSFLISLVISTVKLEKQQEFLVLWTSGLNKIYIANIFILIGFILIIFQLFFTLSINPTLLNKSRVLLKENNNKQINYVLKSNDFSDAFKSVTFYVESKNEKGELKNIFIKDTGGNLKTVLNEIDNSNDTTITAKKGMIIENKLILFNGTIQTFDKKKVIKNINFELTELNISNFNTRTITGIKIQETPSSHLINCIINFYKKNLDICNSNNNLNIFLETISRRIASPLYVLLIPVIISLLLIYKKEKKFYFFKKYFLFILVFIILIVSELLGRYAGFSLYYAIIYFITPILLSIIFYLFLFKKLYFEKI